MEKFLIECGLKKAVGTFTEHSLELRQLKNLTEEEIRELLPKIGDKHKLREAIKRKHAADQSTFPRCKERKKTMSKSETESSKLSKSRDSSLSSDSSQSIKSKRSRKSNNSRKSNIKSSKLIRNESKKEEIIRIFKTDNVLTADVKNAAQKIMEELHLFKNRTSNEFQLLNYERGTLNCPMCETTITPQLRKRIGKTTWISSNWKRHLELPHENVDRSDFNSSNSTIHLLDDSLTETATAQSSSNIAETTSMGPMDNVQQSHCDNGFIVGRKFVEIAQIGIDAEKSDTSDVSKTNTRKSTSEIHSETESNPQMRDDVRTTELSAASVNRETVNGTIELLDNCALSETVTAESGSNLIVGDEFAEIGQIGIDAEKSDASDISKMDTKSTSEIHSETESNPQMRDDVRTIELSAASVNRETVNGTIELLDNGALSETLTAESGSNLIVGDEFAEIGQIGIDAEKSDASDLSKMDTRKSTSEIHSETESNLQMPDVVRTIELSAASVDSETVNCTIHLLDNGALTETVTAECSTNAEKTASMGSITNVQDGGGLIVSSKLAEIGQIGIKAEKSNVKSGIHSNTKSNPHREASMSVSSLNLAENAENVDKEIPDWRKPDVKYGWVKLLSSERFFPGFLFNDGKAKYITARSKVSTFKRKIQEYHQNIPKSEKYATQLKHLKKFNYKNNTKFQ